MTDLFHHTSGTSKTLLLLSLSLVLNLLGFEIFNDNVYQTLNHGEKIEERWNTASQETQVAPYAFDFTNQSGSNPKDCLPTWFHSEILSFEKHHCQVTLRLNQTFLNNRVTSLQLNTRSALLTSSEDDHIIPLS